MGRGRLIKQRGPLLLGVSLKLTNLPDAWGV